MLLSLARDLAPPLATIAMLALMAWMDPELAWQ
jgi:hypothetical protein